ncbi:hypothetical protein Q7P37_002776 [Cladosporium fusiforme]
MQASRAIVLHGAIYTQLHHAPDKRLVTFGDQVRDKPRCHAIGNVPRASSRPRRRCRRDTSLFEQNFFHSLMPPTVVFKEQNDGQTRRHSESSQPGINALSAAVQAASQQQLSLLLQQLCDQDETAADFARRHLFPSPQTPRRIKHRTIPEEATPTKKQPSPPKRPPLLKSILKPTKSPAPEEPQQAEPPPLPPKRKLSIQCRNCGSPFTSSNAEESCTHHPGKREVDPEHKVWEDFDSDVFGDAWTLMEYEAFACGFRWSCCKRGTEEGGEGCTVGVHEAAPLGEWKRGRRL